MFQNLQRCINTEIKEFKDALRAVPGIVTALFILSCVLMNLLANKELFRSDYICINTGLALSWMSFLCMDCVCKRFGSNVAIRLNIVAVVMNFLTSVIFFLLMKFPGNWAAMYSSPDATIGGMINEGLNATFSGAWYVVVGSAIAMLASGIINSLLNVKVGDMSDDGTYKGFAIRSFSSTIVAQWVDNFIFSALVSHVFFGWNWKQVFICATTSMIFELVIEAIFSPIGFRVARNWEKEDVGSSYLRERNVEFGS